MLKLSYSEKKIKTSPLSALFKKTIMYASFPGALPMNYLQ